MVFGNFQNQKNKTGGVKLICDSYMQMEEMYKSVEPNYKSHYNQSKIFI